MRAELAALVSGYGPAKDAAGVKIS